ncbi:DUF445 domain-containing protein [Bradyrhizobium sp. dw_411]|uniref:DUF445 domain-containing protein n=1 Tax=Bradyrhizobium sp. dw_411 TaxID=2720082 RepID=UPI001BD10A65
MVTHAEQRLRDLQRMRLFATALLALMTAIFIATYLVPWQWTWLAYLRAFTEAGMIGACADWFAVVALFRHPLGIPIPHTAIVPHNKERIGGAIGRFISNNFLSPKVLRAKMREIDPAGWAAGWLLHPDNARRIAQRAAATLPQALRAMPRDDLNAFLARMARGGIEAVPAAPLASKILSILWAQGETQALVERGIDMAARALTDNRDRIKVTVTQKSSRFIPKWVDAIVADKIVSGLTQLLDEMRNPAHPWRTELGASVNRLIDDLATKPEFYARGEELKTEVLDNPVVVQQVNRLWTQIEVQLDTNSAVYIGQLAGGLEHALIALGQRLANDPAIRDAVNRWLRIAALRLIAPRRAEIGAFITQVVERWDTETLVNRMELQVGRDLQYIRINGTLVGGLVGLIIFTITRWV